MASPSPPASSLPRRPNASEREIISLLREAFAHADKAQERRAAWWRRLALTDRRTLLALCGLDDSEEVAQRSWPQLAKAAQESLARECRRFGRLLQPMSQ